MPDEPFSLDRMYQAIEQHVFGNVPGLKAVTAWPDIKDRIPLPAMFIEMAELEPGLDQGTGETVLVARFEARIVVDPIRAQHHQQAAHLAAQLAVLLRFQTWGQPIEPAEFVQAMQDWTKPELDGYTVWRVEWTHQIYLGVEEWPWPDEPPGSLVLNIDPGDGPVKPEDL